MTERRHALDSVGRPWLVLVVAVCAAVSAILLSAAQGRTYAAFSDFVVVQGSASAGAWSPATPSQCAGMTFKHILYVPPGGQLFHGTNQSDLIFGSAGDDDIDGGNGKDCIVGHDGNDTIDGGNAKDVLLGGPGDDQLSGSNGPDILDGGPGQDVCYTGHAPDNATNCESVDPPSVGPHVALRAPDVPADGATKENGPVGDTPDDTTRSAGVDSTNTPSSSTPSPGTENDPTADTTPPSDPTSVATP